MNDDTLDIINTMLEELDAISSTSASAIREAAALRDIVAAYKTSKDQIAATQEALERGRSLKSEIAHAIVEAARDWNDKSHRKRVAAQLIEKLEDALAIKPKTNTL